ncbi:hypothetical protein [Brevundimonas sp. PAMC22021]|uniref:hypothetical protein n=1 Tax=Brevundimonas sp. PAMC22021 TaxID=2861285 RepID=UPI001C635A81|nr:hypothetical protein [Brevundimonas sp. PAMC22021]QYF86448.1 hypothetical protein KY493_11515 [Brevundimonas sp. PAMC22021]
MTDPTIDGEGWMRRCVLIAAPRQAEAWRIALAEAALQQGRDVVFLDQAPDASEARDPHRIFVASDHRFLRPSADAERVVLLHGLTHFAGLDAVSEEDARVHLIEMSRFGVEAIDWSRGGRRVAEDAPQRLSLFDDFEVCSPMSPPIGEGLRDQAASKALTYLEAGGQSEWSPALFITNARPAPGAGGDWLDMTGPPRALVRGPYLWAPPGRWKIKLRFMIDGDGAKQEFQFRWGPPLTPVLLKATPAQSGIFEVELENDWAEADGMELTVALPHSAVSGRFCVVGIDVSEFEFRPSA